MAWRPQHRHDVITNSNFRSVVLLASTLFLTIMPVAATSFRVRGLITADQGPRGLAAGDFNGDGKIDLAVGSIFASATVSVFIGNGDGTFQPQVRYGVGTQPWGVAVSDVNLDGNLDLVVANNLDSTVSVLLGNGDGTFQPALTFVTGIGPTDVVLGDFNGDGVPDVVTASTGVSVLLGNGDGTFQTPIDIYSGGGYSVSVGDFNRDGKLDVAIGTAFGSTGVLQVELGNGDGSFTAGSSYSLQVATPYSIAVGDLNHDGNLDLAITTFFNDFWVLLGKGDGTFHQVRYFNPYATYGIVMSDFNRDGNLDVATGDYNDPSYVSVLNGNGDGTFQPVTNYNAHGQNGDVIIAPDLNADGSPDLVLANDISSNLSVFLNTGGTRVTTTSSLNPSHVGQSVTFTTTVKGTVIGGTPTGTVTFKDGTTTLGTVSLSSGKASFTTSTLGQGKHRIGAFYSGDANFNSNSATPLTQFVKP